MAEHFRHLGVYSDWVEAAKSQVDLYPVASPGVQTRRHIRDALGFAGQEPWPREVRIEAAWERDGLAGEEVSWSVGYGPKTRAWVRRRICGVAIPDFSAPIRVGRNYSSEQW